jgi:NAD-reducing hydrogenase small subunit
MRNAIPVSQLLQKIYGGGKDVPGDRLPALLNQSRPVHEFVKVDMCLPGCPPSSKLIAGVLTDLLDGKKPDLAGKVKFG